MKLKDIRKIYTDFFVSKNHTLVKSSSLIPENDPTLLFTNAGMNQFKDVFTGKETRPYTRATSSQKCVRAGGKHNDLDNVGYTTRHHTFFEMLGNFSFGDYFKEEAITYAWEFLSTVLKLDKNKLYFTVYPDDTEARNLWKKIAMVDDNRILNIKDNVWSMGEIGPCGFDTEIFYDKGKSILGGLPGTPDEDGDRYIEIWNNVFMQYETLPNGEKIELKHKNIDTGMGLERIASVLQGVTDNFDIDLFQNLMKYTEDILHIKKTPTNIASFKIITDHIRACSFLIADGVIPSNEGRGYVLRRIIRRALRYINMLGIKEPIFYKITNAVKNEMGDTYDELYKQDLFIKETIKTEEENFITTLDQGIKILETELENTTGTKFSGKTAFKLYDTYGFPLDLTTDILRSKNITVNLQEFENEMQKQKQLSQKSSKFKGEAGNKQLYYEIKDTVGKTKFVGYDNLESNSQITSIIFEDKKLNEIENKKEFFITTNITPFYAESGGQIADIGTITDKQGNNYKVVDVQKVLDDIFLHKIQADFNYNLKVDDNIKMSVNKDNRENIMSNHSAVHLLQSALKKIIGEATSQKGSWVGPNNFRFDFTSQKPVTTNEIKEIEILINSYIDNNLQITATEMPLEEAKKTNAIALFGEKYKDIVRVVKMGDVSTEFCGGTHCNNTTQIKFFKIIKEESIASGIRRIEGIAGNSAINFAKKYLTNINKPAKNLIIELQNAIETENIKKQKLEKERLQNQKEQESKNKNQIINSCLKNFKTENINNIKFIYSIYNNIETATIKTVIDKIKVENNTNTLISLFTINDNKISVIIAVSDDLINKISAINLVKQTSTILKGNGGGGKPNLAQAGGIDKENIPNAIQNFKNILSQL